MVDEGGVDVKLLAVAHLQLTNLYDHVNEATDLPELLLQQIGHFFSHYKELIKVSGQRWITGRFSAS